MARILIFESDVVLRRLLGLQLEHLGHEVIVATEKTSPAELEFDLAVVEPTTPEGFAAAWLLRRLRPGVPLLFASIKDPTGDTAALLPEAHLVKPFTLAELQRAVAAALG